MSEGGDIDGDDLGELVPVGLGEAAVVAEAGVVDEEVGGETQGGAAVGEGVALGGDGEVAGEAVHQEGGVGAAEGVG